MSKKKSNAIFSVENWLLHYDKFLSNYFDIKKDLQLNKCETDPYFLQNFQCTTMFISAFCKIFELNTEHEIVFVLISVDSQGDITQV